MTLLCCLSVLAMSNVVSAQCAPLAELIIDITADQFPGENTWSLTEDGVEIAFGGGDSQNVTVCVDVLKCHEFTMADSYGDGQYGSAFGGVDGTTTITLDGTEVFSSTGDWGGSISGNFGGCTSGCGDITANNYDATADIIDNSLCTYDVAQGCTVVSACNYDAAAVVDDGSCTYADAGFDCNGDCLVGVAVVYAPGGFSGENSFTINDCDGNVLASMAAGTASFNSCVNLPAIYTVILTDSYGDTWNGGTLTVGGVVYDQPTTAGAGTATSDSYQVGGACPVYGCTDPTAANYDSLATVNATSSSDPTDPCTYGIPGCTDVTACNFDAGATANDGSCTYAGPGLDCNGDCLAGSPVVITLTDSYGDTWNGGTLTVGGVVYDQPTTAGAGTVTSDSYNACLDLLGCLVVEYNTGAFSGEHSWSIADDAGVVLASGIGSTGAYGTTLGDGCGVLGCADASAINYDATADSCDGLVGGTDTSCCTYPPVNDDCADAIAVACGDVVSGSSLNSTVGNEVLALECGTAIGGAGVWYSFASAGSEEVTFSTCGSALDTKINVYSGSCGAYVCAGGNDDDCGVQSNVTVITSAAPTDYYIHVSGWNGNTGLFDLAVTCDVATCTPPVNDVCDSSFPIPDGVAYVDDNVCAQANDLNPACAGFGFVDGVWYTWNSGANNALALAFGPAATPDLGDSAAVNPSIAMFSGNCANPTELNCFNGTVTQEITGLTIATTYYFLVFTDDDVDQGQFDLMLTGGVAGCTTVGACNYDASASVDDGSCDLSCLGCTDSLALNYDPAALADDGSCVVPSCDPIVSTEAAICYDSNGNVTYNFLENTLGEGVSIAFNAGTVEAGWDEIYVYDDLGTQLNVQFDGDLTGLIFTSAGAMSINIISDASVSCASGSQTEISLTVYCGALEVVGCFDPLATNYDDTANSGDQVALCQYLGCTDAAACNYNALALTDDGTCCLTNCVTVEISDSFGDGGTSVTIFDDLGTVVASLVGSGFGNTETFCIPDACADVVVSVDGFPGEAGVTITDASTGVLLDFGAGTITAGSTTTVTVGAAVGCVVSGCTDALALNYNAAANADCLDVFGGANVTCCIYPVANNDCDGAIALLAGVETAWDSNNSDDSGNNCSPTLTNDVWYSYTPACDLEVTVSSASNQGGEVAIWEGDCAALTLVECGPNAGFITTTITAILTGGVTYSIQTGSNSDFSPVSTGTIILEEGLCRGCTYIASPDYSAAAGVDDGSCTFEDCSCPGDFTGDGFVNVSDLGGFLGAFGEACD